MIFETLRHIADCEQLTPHQKLIFQRLALYGKYDKRQKTIYDIFPSVTTAARLLGVSPTTVRNTLQKGVRMGFITCEEVYDGKGLRKPNYYEIITTKLFEVLTVNNPVYKRCTKKDTPSTIGGVPPQPLVDTPSMVGYKQLILTTH